jgi:peptidoglycan/LPS O-acetylase OafA/YrhL
LKITQITFTRFVAALAIVISHFNKDVFLYKIPYLSEVFLRANVGVSYFFILSGFIMIIAYHKKEKNRLRRLLSEQIRKNLSFVCSGIAIVVVYSGRKIFIHRYSFISLWATELDSG